MAPSKSNGHWTKGMPRKTLLGFGFCLLLESKLLESCCSRKQDMSLILPSHLICEGGYMKREIRRQTKSTDEIEEYQMKEKLKILQINGVAFKLQYKTPWTAKMIIYLKDMWQMDHWWGAGVGVHLGRADKEGSQCTMHHVLAFLWFCTVGIYGLYKY